MTQETTQIEETQKLDEVIQQSGLQVQEADEVKSNYLPFLNQLHSIKEQSVKINKENPTDIDEKIARELRLKTVKIRTGAEEVKDDRKKIHLLKGNLEQAAYNLIKADCLLIEAAFTQIEKAREIAEKKRKAELKAERLVIMEPYESVCSTQFIDLENMGEDDFQKLLDGARLSLETKLEAEKKAEEERLAVIEAERIRQEEIRLENERLKKEAEEKEKALAEERAKVEAERKKQEAIRLAEQKKADELLAKQKAEAEAKLKSEQEKAKKAQEEADKKLAEERKLAEEKLAKEMESARKLEAELKAKKDAEEAEKKRLEAEEKARIEAEKKAAKAPKKQRLNNWIDSFVMGTPTGMNDDETVIEILAKFEGFKSWAKSKIESI